MNGRKFTPVFSGRIESNCWTPASSPGFQGSVFPQGPVIASPIASYIRRCSVRSGVS